MQEPLELLLEKHGINPSRVKHLVTGMKYTAVMLDNGNIGVCANLGTPVVPDTTEYRHLDLGSATHRIMAVAYFNALLNYTHTVDTEGDVFDVIPFDSRSNIVMLGYFAPVVARFEAAGIPLTVFDLEKDGEHIAPENGKASALAVADAVILTSTALSNNTFVNCMAAISTSSVHLLGPSSLLDPLLFDMGVTSISGTRFRPYDERVLELIASNMGTRTFIKLGQKVTLSA